MLAAVRGSVAQFSHGQLAPAKRPHRGDWILYYSPKERRGESTPCQRFVAVGQVLDDEPRQVVQTADFRPWRRRVVYREASEVNIRPLIRRLSFVKDKQKWGATFRFGFLEIEKNDFDLIVSTMEDSDEPFERRARVARKRPPARG